MQTNLDKRSTGRPSYSHLLCYAKQPTTTPSPASTEANTDNATATSATDLADDTKPTHNSHLSKLSENDKRISVTYRTGLFAIPDIFYRGEMVWPKGIGLDCCYAGAAFLKEVAGATCIVDPFAGQGTVVAMANALGVDAIGVEISPKRCRRASRLSLRGKLDLVSPFIRNITVEVVKERKEALAAAHVPRNKPVETVVTAETVENAQTVAESQEPALLAAAVERVTLNGN